MNEAQQKLFDDLVTGDTKYTAEVRAARNRLETLLDVMAEDKILKALKSTKI